MEKCNNGALVLPREYAVMNENDMRSIEGGAINLAMSRNYLRKNYCLREASNLITRHIVVGMTQTQIAQEIYAHAMVKYGFDALPQPLRGLAQSTGVYNSANNGIYIEDYGDSALRQKLYSDVWLL